MENLNTNLVAENNMEVVAFNEELNNVVVQNNEDNKMVNVNYDNLTVQNDILIDGVVVNDEISVSNESTITLENTISSEPTIVVNENTGVNISYIASDNSTFSSEVIDKEDSSTTSKYDNTNVLSYMEARNNCYNKEHFANNKLLEILNKNQTFIWMTSKGEYCYKIGHNGAINEVTESKLKKILKNKLKFPVYIDSEESGHADKNINTCCLHLVSKDTFDPHQDKEFFEKDGQIYRNLFVKTDCLLLDEDGNYNEPTTIIALVKNLVNNDEERYTYLINWLANFIQTMERTPVAIIIKGKQGTGKNLFIEKVLMPIFGETQVAVIGDKEIRKQFVGSLFENKLFYALDEISHSYKDNFQLQNFLKQVIGSNNIFMEKKHENTKEEIRLWGPVLIFSNKSVPIAIETNSRREVIFKSGQPLTKIDFLGCGSYENLCDRIKSELRDFTLMLLNWQVDKNMASIAMDTPEKVALANMTHDKIALFHEAITSGDISYFEELKEEFPMGACLYSELEEDFKAHKVKRNDLASIYNVLYEEKIATKTLLNLLRTFDDEFYNNNNTISDGKGGKYFLLDGHPKKDLKEESIYVDDASIQNTATSFIPKPLLPIQ